jgi:hypothetical protein
VAAVGAAGGTLADAARAISDGADRAGAAAAEPRLAAIWEAACAWSPRWAAERGHALLAERLRLDLARAAREPLKEPAATDCLRDIAAACHALDRFEEWETARRVRGLEPERDRQRRLRGDGWDAVANTGAKPGRQGGHEKSSG